MRRESIVDLPLRWMGICTWYLERILPLFISFSFSSFFLRLIFSSFYFLPISFFSFCTVDPFLSSIGTTCISIQEESAIKTKRCHSFPSTFFSLSLSYFLSKRKVPTFFLFFRFFDDGRKCVQGTNNSFSSRCDPILRWCSVWFQTALFQNHP